MFKELRYLTFVTLGIAGLILAVCLSCFGLNQRGSKTTRGDRQANTQLVVLVKASRSLVTLPPRGVDPAGLLCELTESEVRLSANATDPHGRYVNFSWQVPAGRLIGKGGLEVTWDLSGVKEGTYAAKVEASDRHKHTGSGSVEGVPNRSSPSPDEHAQIGSYARARMRPPFQWPQCSL